MPFFSSFSFISVINRKKSFYYLKLKRELNKRLLYITEGEYPSHFGLWHYYYLPSKNEISTSKHTTLLAHHCKMSNCFLTLPGRALLSLPHSHPQRQSQAHCMFLHCPSPLSSFPCYQL